MSFSHFSQNAFGATGADSTTQPSWMSSFIGLSSVFGALGLFSQSYLGSSLKLLVLGSLIETGRRFCWWLIERFRIQYSLTAQFNEGDPAYEWIVLFITQERVWKRSREFVVTATNSDRKWAVKATSDLKVVGSAEYVPTYSTPMLFKWRGYWVDIKRNNERAGASVNGVQQQSGRISLTIYTLDMDVLSQLVEEARKRYVEVNRPHVVVYLSDAGRYNPNRMWNTVKHKIRRPLSSIILPSGLLDSLVEDAEEFLRSEDWYISAGIPHRRGYLLHGPPGTGKTSTIYALAGALNLEIYSLSLASYAVDDSFLQRAASNIPKNGILLIEDIDCAFPSRADEEDELAMMMPEPVMRTSAGTMRARPTATVTLSGLLNVIDGVGSEEGRIFFATTNYIDRLDGALLRPGRIDRKVEYTLSTNEQTHGLFVRFFPEARFPELAADSPNESDAKSTHTIDTLATQFAQGVPAGEFSTAELQGAAEGVVAWVEEERRDRAAREAREEERRAKAQLRMQQQKQNMGGAHAFGGAAGHAGVSPAGGEGAVFRGGRKSNNIAAARTAPVDVSSSTIRTDTAGAVTVEPTITIASLA
ncbi:hypothetical protein MVEN_02234500 [Mycena venus]|uniref:P-loop containing nucleoside triphosphate hydrolase protein n=1 Tax=Mycena venus TaxID=2733690 RepID=A0A8H7CFU6_9AGAR|nr:hypothetical protein MVEN_02234500 [Mycena venus]